MTKLSQEELEKKVNFGDKIVSDFDNAFKRMADIIKQENFPEKK